MSALGSSEGADVVVESVTIQQYPQVHKNIHAFSTMTPFRSEG